MAACVGKEGHHGNTRRQWSLRRLLWLQVTECRRHIPLIPLKCDDNNIRLQVRSVKERSHVQQEAQLLLGDRATRKHAKDS